jgi:AmiR/NasT family two-component response regulator
MTLENGNQENNSIKTVIVEDEIIIARDIKQTLEKAGHEVLRMFMSGEEAAKKIPALGADVILMDVYLKGPLDGIEVAEIISLSANLPIVFITGHSEHTIMSRIKFTENYGIVLKPFNSNTLLTSVELAYRNHKKKNRVKQEHPVPAYAGRMDNAIIGSTIWLIVSPPPTLSTLIPLLLRNMAKR